VTTQIALLARFPSDASRLEQQVQIHAELAWDSGLYNTRRKVQADEDVDSEGTLLCTYSRAIAGSAGSFEEC